MWIAIFFYVVFVVSKKTGSVFVWQLSDIHIDLKYMEGGDPECDIEGACCREKNPSQKHHAGKYGSFENKGWCGIPLITFQETVNFVNEKSIELGFDDFIVVYTGDQSGQDESIQTVKENYDILNAVYSTMNDKLRVVYPSEGNHDTWPCQQLDLRSSFLPWHLDQWKNWLDDDVLKMTTDKLYYTVLLENGFRLVSMNTNWNSLRNDWMIVHDTHWKEMVIWLETTLFEAKMNQEKVLMIGHVPPGEAGTIGSSSYNFEEYENTMGTLFATYNETIITYLVGHEHVARFGLVTAPSTPFRNNFPESSVVYWPTGSVLNSHGESCFDLVNPSVRLYEFSRDKNFELVEVYQYWNNLTYSNLARDFRKGWAEQPLTMKKDFGLKDLSPKSLEKFITEIETNEQTYQKFLNMYTSNYHNEGCVCDGVCKRHLICQMRFSNHEQFSGCMYEQ